MYSGSFPTFALAIRWPTREDAIRRLELRSGVPHRPASTYEDTLTNVPPDGATAAIWRAHRARVAERLSKLEVGPPLPRTDRADPLGLRAALMLAVVAALAFVGDSTSDRLQAAFRFTSTAELLAARLDAWVTPPPYTARPPILLSDGARRDVAAADPAPRVFEVPEQSAVFVRLGGKGPVALKLEYFDADGKPIGTTDGAATVEQGDGGTAAPSSAPNPVVTP